MFTVLTCIADQHDPRLLLVALVICVLSAATGLSIYARAAATRGVARTAWCAFAGFVTGCGVWATHFLSMLAYQARLRIAYDFDLTAISLAAAIAILSCGFFIAARSRKTPGRMLGGATLGAGVVAMHLVGEAAARGPVILQFDRGLFAAALVIGPILGAAAMAVVGRGALVRRIWAGAGLLVLAICSLHFAATAAITLAPDAVLAGPDAASARMSLAFDAGAVASLVLITAIAMLAVSRLSALAALSSLHSALDEAPSAIGFFDSKQRLTFWNQPYAELFEVFGLEPAVGLRFDTILAAAMAAGVPYRAGHEAAQAGAFSWDNPPDELELPDGRAIHAKLGPTRDGGMVAVLVDVTQARQAERLANEARERAEAANRLKSDFLATMGHEIRTPLNGVLGMAHVMEASPLEPAQRERLQVIKTSGESLLGLLNDMLDLAKIEAGYMKLDDSAFDLEATLRQACESFATMAAEKGVAFDFCLAPAAAGQWRGDPKRMRQVVANLVANAVKFTATGAVGVVVDTTETGLRIVVRDTGIGMKPEQIPQLFEKFTQADSSSTRQFGGTGLGLAICRELTELMGGTLTADSIEGQGSIFTFEAPLVILAPADAPRPEPANKPQPGGRLRVLAAEDNLINQKVLAGLLESVDADLVMVADGEEAVAAYRQGGFDVVLMDIRMPKMSGIEATRAIRAWEAQHGLPQVPILAVTANMMTHHVAGYLAAGMDGVIAKPIELKKLLAALAEISPLARAA
ncbi:ATP-binding protein [Phenylobacterium sp.]|uniref:ATP-binding protein n=1 Tax=Phenylobacterium sp. TaxID=1871053 RepID=UPI0012100C5A|nr:ATP-binding protein [Phenylobacterium sp.]THD64390.1 MAG: response regulator [Phenylobacterium sp.]